MLTTAQLIEWRALTDGPDGAAPSTPILAERGMLLALLDEVLAGRDGWQPGDTAPRDGTRILGYFADIGVWQVAWEESGSGLEIWCVDDRKHGPYPLRGNQGDPTLWQPNPEPPEQEQAP